MGGWAFGFLSEFGSPLEVEKSGMLRAGFTDDGKLDELEMMFDGIAVHQQLQRAMGASNWLCLPVFSLTRSLGWLVGSLVSWLVGWLVDYLVG